MRETVTIETEEGKKIGNAEIISNPEHAPNEIMVTLDGPRVFHLHRISKGHLIYRPHYVPLAENFHK